MGIRDLSIRFSRLKFSKRKKIEKTLFPEEAEALSSLGFADRNRRLVYLVIGAELQERFEELINQHEQDGQ